MENNQVSSHPFLEHDCYGILGAGQSGRAAARLLLSLEKRVIVYDDHALALESDAFAALVQQGVQFVCGTNEELSPQLEALVVSPGVPASHPKMLQANERGLPVRGELELGALFVGEGTLVGITGTNGKTTVTTMVHQICEAAGGISLAVGNIGYPLCDAVLDVAEKKATYVTEVSSFQLETVETFRPRVGLILNLTPDHLDRHQDMEGYAAMKGRLTARQTEDDVLVINQDDPYCLGIAQESRARQMRFSLERPVEEGTWLDGNLLMMKREGAKPQRLLEMDELELVGLHNVANALAAAAVGLALGIGRKTIAKTLRAFKAAPHRMEPVTELNGVAYINDSKATNLGAMLRAVECYSGGIHLIAGGRDKDSPFASIKGDLMNRLRGAYLIGESAEVIARAWEPEIPCHRSGTLAQALEEATAAAAEEDCILLSPGCASFDQFTSYAARGDAFREWVLARKAT